MYLTMLETDADRERFLRLYDACNKLVYATAFSILKNKMQAEDAAQHTWMKAIDIFERISSLPLNEAKECLVVMVRNQSFLMAERSRREIPVDEMRTLNSTPPKGIDDDGAYLVEMIRSMPENYRRVLELRLVLELSTAETAKILQIPASTGTTRLQRGREMLQEKLRKEGYAP